MHSTSWTLNRRSIYRTSMYAEARTLYVDWYTYSTDTRIVLEQRTLNSWLFTFVHWTCTDMASKPNIISFILPTDGNKNTKDKVKFTVDLYFGDVALNTRYHSWFFQWLKTHYKISQTDTLTLFSEWTRHTYIWKLYPYCPRNWYLCMIAEIKCVCLVLFILL